MKCPKCGYLGFEDVDRCRNCGYDFSLSEPVLDELPLQRPATTPTPLEDLALVDDLTPNRERASVPPTTSFESSAGELPLFGSENRSPFAFDALSPADDDTPLITNVSAPRPPLAVRRATPEIPRTRSATRRRTPMLELGAFDSEPSSGISERSVPAGWTPPAVESATAVEPAGVGARLGAAIVDVTILLAIDALVVYLTMEICGITLDDFQMIPKGPLLAFLAAQNLAYFIGFTVNGQTLGKMLTGIKVVSADDRTGLDIGHSAVRTLVWVALAVPAGLGFVTTLFGRDHRGLHDRCAGTKVVRASA